MLKGSDNSNSENGDVSEATDEDDSFVPSDQSDNLEAEPEHECDNFSSEALNSTAKQWPTVHTQPWCSVHKTMTHFRLRWWTMCNVTLWKISMSFNSNIIDICKSLLFLEFIAHQCYISAEDQRHVCGTHARRFQVL